MNSYGRVLVTGGGGAIGSNVTDELVLAGADEIIVLDNFVRGRRENLDWARANGNVHLVEGDIRDEALVRELMDGIDLVFQPAPNCFRARGVEPSCLLQASLDQLSRRRRRPRCW